MEQTQSQEQLQTVLLRFPPTQSKRAVYFDVMDAALREALVMQGYRPKLLMELPRESEEDSRAYLLALAQGMSEDTIFASKERLNACELEMKARKMLTAKELPATKTRSEESVESILATWTSSHHSGREPTPGNEPTKPKARTQESNEGGSALDTASSSLGESIPLLYARKQTS